MTAANFLALVGLAVAGWAVIIGAHSILRTAGSKRGSVLQFALTLSVFAAALLVIAMLHPVKSVNGAAGVLVLTLGGYILYEAFLVRVRTRSAAAAAQPAPVVSDDRSQRVALILLATSAALLGYVVVADLAVEGSPHEVAFPPPGSVVNSISGEIEDHVAIRGPASGGGAQIAGGPNFRACNLSARASCSYPPGSRPIAAHAGDSINFKLRVYNPMAEPLPYAKFYAIWGQDSHHPRLLRVEMAIEWPYGHNAGVGRPGIEEVLLALPSVTSSANLVYIPGSTALLNRTGGVVGKLPDGIMGRGIALADIGSPQSCFECDLTYTRFITFKARVH
jgi:hypothetical protein